MSDENKINEEKQQAEAQNIENTSEVENVEVSETKENSKKSNLDSTETNLVEKPLDIEVDSVITEETAVEKEEEEIAPSDDKPSEKNTEETAVEEEEVITSSNAEPSNEAKVETAIKEDEKDEEEITSSDEDPLEEDSEETTKTEALDYSSLNQTSLISALQELVATQDVQKIKNDAEEIKTEFNNQFQEELAEKKETFLAEGGNTIDFHYTSKNKAAFNDAYGEYRTKRNAHYKDLKHELENNLNNREALIGEIKSILDSEESANKNYNKLKGIQERWKNAGPIPRDKYNTVWNNYHHYMETYYDALHLDREFRDLDFKHNLEEKRKLIKRTEELTTETNIDKAFRELQLIHRRWKEEVGPVAREFRDEIWDTFSAATKIIHDKKQEAEAALQETFHENYNVKKELIGLIDRVKAEITPSHNAWQKGMKQVQEIRDVFFQAGSVPKEKNKEIWANFKETTRNFNKAKNQFYKDQKNQQFDNLEKKRALIKIAEDNKDSEDFDSATQLYKKVQHDWKSIGHVPRKDSDKIWKEFKAACNHYFERLHSLKDEENKEEFANFEKKEALLELTSNLKMSDDHKENVKNIKDKITEWKSIGRVPYKKKNIDQKFNKVLDSLFSKLDLGKKETELIKFENKLSAMVSQEDDRQLQNEQFYIGKKIDETKAEIMQLENNLGFFQHVPDDNPMVAEVHKNIARHKEQLQLWIEKLKKIKAARN